MSLLNLIKEIGRDAVGSDDPVAVLYAAVTRVSPLEVSVDQRFRLAEDFLVVLDHVTDIRVGSSLVLLRVQGGQSFIVLGKAAES
ncbi:DUF2577 domain-containing protein [Paenibacillus sp. FJAT-26967]|uniref:DUF2577 domain-containing protein n=1 Tax=Paenibacillus sp. FJAT-26967 TaxID=1729690 RepID=UPI000837E95B|nr:DUF2577 domain-containing protein [Paenibacillus sp. FJAT-26967]